MVMMDMFYSLYGRMLHAQALEAAYKQVARAKDAAGIDGQSLSDLAAGLQSNLHILLLNWKVKPIKRSLIVG